VARHRCSRCWSDMSDLDVAVGTPVCSFCLLVEADGLVAELNASAKVLDESAVKLRVAIAFEQKCVRDGAHDRERVQELNLAAKRLTSARKARPG
jgi:hypothetical protein